VHTLLSDRSTKGLFNLFYNDLRKYEDKFFNYLRMSIKSFDELVSVAVDRMNRMRVFTSKQYKFNWRRDYFGRAFSIFGGMN
jgi:hypothetical protein